MSIFSKVGGLKPGLTAFNLSHNHLFDCNFGQLVPIACLETLPGDVFDINIDVVGRLTSALKSPILSQMDIILEAFYCPTRLLMGRDANFDTPVGEVTFEDFLSGGQDGKHIGNESYPLPRISPISDNIVIPFPFKTGGLGDYLGVQTNVDLRNSDYPLAFPWRCYRWIWNEFYRDENLVNPIQVCGYLGNGLQHEDPTALSLDVYDSLLYRSWRKDYFTSALPFQQRGTSPALPISGILSVQADVGVDPNRAFYPTSFASQTLIGTGSANDRNIRAFFPSGSPTEPNTLGYPQFAKSATEGAEHPYGFVNLENAATFDVNQIRTAFQVQKWLERNARGGVRYTEYLRSHFGVAPTDARLQRPQFIGSTRSPWLVNEVLQTSETNSSVTPQGNQAGQAINLSRSNIGRFRSFEYGYLMILCSVVPKALYQQGIPRWLNRRTNLDFYTPEFAHLSEQPVKNKEIFYDSSNPDGTFGFQPIWNEYRFIPSKVSGHMRTNASDYSYDYWHFARYFASLPSLNEDFLTIGKSSSSKSELMRVFAVQDENPFIINAGINIKALRPMPYLSEPGLIDHF